MDDFTDGKGKTSRRRFAKTVASALVAVPIISSLSSCSEQPGTNRSSDNSATPNPETSPTPTPTPGIVITGNPPVVIDGGSLGISSPATFRDDRDDETTPKRYDHKFRQRNSVLGAVKGIRISNDYGDLLLPDRTLQGSETLKVYLWIQKVTREMGDDDDDTDQAEYGPIANQSIPEVIIQGGPLEIRSDKTIPKARKLFKRRGRNHKRFERNDWDGKFRVAQVKVFVSGIANPIFTSTEDQADNGFRIMLGFT